MNNRIYPSGDKSIRGWKTKAKGSLPGVPISDNQQIVDTDMGRVHMANIECLSKSDVVGHSPQLHNAAEAFPRPHAPRRAGCPSVQSRRPSNSKLYAQKIKRDILFSRPTPFACPYLKSRSSHHRNRSSVEWRRSPAPRVPDPIDSLDAETIIRRGLSTYRPIVGVCLWQVRQAGRQVAVR